MKEKARRADCAREIEAWIAVWNSGLMLKNTARQFFRNKGTTETQFKVLLRLKYADHPLNQRELSEQLLVDKSDLTGLVDRMVRADLLTRVGIEGDRRSHHLKLSAKALDILDRIEVPYLEMIRRVMSVFSGEEQLKIIALMTELHNSLDTRCGCPVPPFPVPEMKG